MIALVEGYALGGGLELALAADFIVAAEGAQLGLPEVTVGIHPGMGGATRLSRLIGRARTKLLTYSGVPVSAEEAYRLGFVARLLPAGAAREEAQALAELIASRAPLAVRWVKQVIDRGEDAAMATALHLEAKSDGHTFGTTDRKEGMRAFSEQAQAEVRREVAVRRPEARRPRTRRHRGSDGSRGRDLSPDQPSQPYGS